MFVILIFILLINYRLQYEGTPKYLGESGTAIWIGTQNLTEQFVQGSMGVGQGLLQMCRWVNMTLVHMCKGFSNLNKEEDNCDVISMMSLSCCLQKMGNSIKRLLHELGGSVPVWVLAGQATDSLSQLSQYLSRSRNIKHTGKCSLFVYCSCMHPRFTWMAWVNIFKLLVC